MRLHSLIVIVAAAGTSAANFLADLPSATPTATEEIKRDISTSETAIATETRDPWQCITENITQYFDVPKPTGSLIDSFNSFGDEIAKPCLATATGTDIFYCTVKDPKSWCAFSTAAPPSAMKDYSSFVTSAVSFWTENSETISVLSTSCAVAWARQGPVNHEWLKIATAHARCYLDAEKPTATSSTNSETTTVSITSGSLASATSTSSTSNPAPGTSTTASNVASLDGRSCEALTLMGTGLAILSNVI